MWGGSKVERGGRRKKKGHTTHIDLKSEGYSGLDKVHWWFAL